MKVVKTSTSHIMVNVKRHLFKEAEDLHNNKYMKSVDLSCFERKRIALGLSGILGLIDQQSQHKLFDTATWKLLKRKFSKHYTLPVIDIDE
ncbi:unnamed protein product [Rhizopus stolonifer]